MSGNRLARRVGDFSELCERLGVARAGEQEQVVPRAVRGLEESRRAAVFRRGERHIGKAVAGGDFTFVAAPVFGGERALAVVDGEFADRVLEFVLHETERRHDAGDVIADVLRDGVSQRGERGDPLGSAEHLIADRRYVLASSCRAGLGLALAAIGEGQLPGEIEGVLHAGVHALSAGRAVDVGRVAGKQHTARR